MIGTVIIVQDRRQLVGKLSGTSGPPVLIIEMTAGDDGRARSVMFLRSFLGEEDPGLAHITPEEGGIWNIP